MAKHLPLMPRDRLRKNRKSNALLIKTPQAVLAIKTPLLKFSAVQIDLEIDVVASVGSSPRETETIVAQRGSEEHACTVLRHPYIPNGGGWPRAVLFLSPHLVPRFDHPRGNIPELVGNVCNT